MSTQYETIFDDELKFEKALVEKLSKDYGWKDNVLVYPSEGELIKNWADIIFQNNKEIDVLNDEPLTEGEMAQIVSHFNGRTPYSINKELVSEGTISITRDNEADKLHFGKDVSVFLFNSQEIKGGRSVYQIVRQPKLMKKDYMARDRRGDIMLLINGMPLFHIELKKSGEDIEQAEAQIKKYHSENVYTGIFSLVQIFVAMNPSETVYFANPGAYDRFNSNYFFHWANFDNIPVDNWAEIARDFLSIPMAHQLIGYYTVADGSEEVLKVMRSYQIYAAQRIIDRVKRALWNRSDKLGGYVAACTGSGKTLTSYKSAQLIRDLALADKVVFLMDRIELGNQSSLEYKNFADDEDDINVTEHTYSLIGKLRASDRDKTLIVTSIQKMSRVNSDSVIRTKDLEIIKGKKIVFIVDECHRSTFGSMLHDIKKIFPNALYFGFTGTPILSENAKKDNETSDLFGNELHLYSLADGIRDKNILGFDTYSMLTFEEQGLRTLIGLRKANASTIEEVRLDKKKQEVFLYYTNVCPMIDIEKILTSAQYDDNDVHHDVVVDDIIKGWEIKSCFRKFSGILATSSIPEAIAYYKLFKKKGSDLHITALFDANDDGDFGIEKNQAIRSILTDYNGMFGQSFKIADYNGDFKTDVSTRLAHKENYLDIHKYPEKRIDLLIVVNQMLTGFDSKYLNTLYLDKIIENEQIIQAFSRTNRLYGPEKQFGIIKYYRKPATMKDNIDKAVRLYSKDRTLSIFVEKLPQNINRMNAWYAEISDIFRTAKIKNFQQLPLDDASKRKFAKAFKCLDSVIEAAKIQGFSWDVTEYPDEDGNIISLQLDENTYDVLLARYKDLFTSGGGGGGFNIAYDVDGHITARDTEKIDAEYMNAKFKKFISVLNEGNERLRKEALEELHRSYATLSEEDQKYAELFLHDIESHSVELEEGKTFKDYVNAYKAKAKNSQIHQLASVFGLNEALLRNIMSHRPDESTINQFGKYDELKATANRNLVDRYFQSKDSTLAGRKITNAFDKLLRTFILQGGFELFAHTLSDSTYDYVIENDAAIMVAESSVPYGVKND